MPGSDSAQGPNTPFSIILSDVLGDIKRLDEQKLETYLSRFSVSKTLPKAYSDTTLFQAGMSLQTELVERILYKAQDRRRIRERLDGLFESANKDLLFEKSFLVFTYAHQDFDHVFAALGQKLVANKLFDVALRYYEAIDDQQGIIDVEFERAKATDFRGGVQSISTMLAQKHTERIRELADYFLNKEEFPSFEDYSWNSFKRVHETQTIVYHPIENTMHGIALYRLLGMVPSTKMLLKGASTLTEKLEAEETGGNDTMSCLLGYHHNVLVEGKEVYGLILQDKDWTKYAGEHLQLHRDNLSYIARGLTDEVLNCYYPGTINWDADLAQKAIAFYAEAEDKEGLLSFADRAITTSKNCQDDLRNAMTLSAADALGLAGEPMAAAYLRNKKD